MGQFRKTNGYRLGLLHQRGAFLPNSETGYCQKYVRFPHLTRLSHFELER